MTEKSLTKTLTFQIFFTRGLFLLLFSLKVNQLSANSLPLGLTIQFSGNITKTYDGTNKAFVTSGHYNIIGIYPGDDVSLSVQAIYSAAQVGARSISITQLILTGADKDKYFILSNENNLTGLITPKSISATVNPTRPFSKEYDGTSTGPVLNNQLQLDSVILFDNVYPMADVNFSDKLASNNKTVIVSNITLAGAQRNNYVLLNNTITTTGQIYPRGVTVYYSFDTDLFKIYDQTDTISVTQQNLILDRKIEIENLEVSATGFFENAEVETNKLITVKNFFLSGVDAANYYVTNPMSYGLAEIKPLSITVGIKDTVLSKAYDATPHLFSITSDYFELHGVLHNDAITAGATADFENKNVGENKALTIRPFLLGASAKNYTLASDTINAKGQIKPIPVIAQPNIAVPVSKVYDGTVTAYFSKYNYNVSGLLNNDEIYFLFNAVFEDKDAGLHKQVIVNNITIDGPDAGNYYLSAPFNIATGEIQKREIQILLNPTPASTKIYDGNTNIKLTEDNIKIFGIINGEDVKVTYLTDANFDNQHGGTGKSITVENFALTGRASYNYMLSSTTYSGNIGSILPKPLVLELQSLTKTYGSPDPTLIYKAEGLITGETVPGLTRTPGENAGDYPYTFSSDNTDYLITNVNAAVLHIEPAELTIKADNKTKKAGEADPLFTFSFDGFVNNESARSLGVLPTARTMAHHAEMGQYPIKIETTKVPNYKIRYVDGILSVEPGGDKSLLKVWTPAPGSLKANIYVDKPQKSTVRLYSLTGVLLYSRQIQLFKGVNNIDMFPNLGKANYVLNVHSDTFTESRQFFLP